MQMTRPNEQMTWPNEDPFPNGFTRRCVLSASLTSALGLALSSGAVRGESPTAPPIPTQFPKDTSLVIGDPATHTALELSGLAKELPFRAQWANMSGGPQTTEAFRAGALDVGSVADIPAINAAWTGLAVKIVGVSFRRDPAATPKYELGIAPNAGVKTIADLRGKRIAYSPGQVQGAIILRAMQKVGLAKKDVTLVELPSTGDVYTVLLSSRQIDVAPISGVAVKRYLARFARDGASVIPHTVEDDASFVYVRKAVVDDPAKSAALREYLKYWALAQEWIASHRQEWAVGFYEKSQGLAPDDAQYLVKTDGDPLFPDDWAQAIERQQKTIELLAQENGKPVFDAATLFDRRYEHAAAAAVAQSAASSPAVER
jgi:sulfonate transport system substrate-binding protein